MGNYSGETPSGLKTSSVSTPGLGRQERHGSPTPHAQSMGGSTGTHSSAGRFSPTRVTEQQIINHQEVLCSIFAVTAGA